MAYVEGGQLDVGVLVAYPLLQRAHGVFSLHRLGPNHVGYLEIEGHVLSAACQYGMRGSQGRRSRAYKLEDVARSTCSSKALLVDDPNQPAMAMESTLCAGGDYDYYYLRGSDGRRACEAGWAKLLGGWAWVRACGLGGGWWWWWWLGAVGSKQLQCEESGLG